MRFRRWMASWLALVLLFATGAVGSAAEGQTDAENPTGPPETIGVASYGGSGDPTIAPDEEFVTDSYPTMDQYRFRDDGPIDFPIRITRYFGPVDANGHLLHPENIEGGSVQLTLKVWDVDQLQGEVDVVTINGYNVGSLTGSNGQWSTFTVDVPVSQLKFPTLSGGSVVPAENWVHVDIDVVTQWAWAVQVDWGRLVARGIRPALLVHGFMSNGSTWDGWRDTFGPEVGLPVYPLTFANNTGSLWNHRYEVQSAINAMKTMYGVSKVNIVGHSKGGIDSRAYLAMGGADVDKLIMVGTPNCGSPLADLVKAGSYGSGVANALVSGLADPALTELMTTYMRFVANPAISRNPNTSYYTIAGNWSDGWIIDGNPLIWGNDDGVVAVSSVECLGFPASIGHTTDFHTSLTSSAAVFGLAKPYLLPGAAGGAGAAGFSALGGAGMQGINLLEQHAITNGSTVYNVPVEAGAAATFGLIWSGGDLTVSAESPFGGALTEGPGVHIFKQVDPALGVTYLLYKLDAPAGGTYKLNVSTASLSEIRYLVVGQTDNAPAFTLSLRGGGLVPAGESTILETTLDWGAVSPVPVTVSARLLMGDGSVLTAAMLDDGSGDDTAAGDGRYTLTIKPGPGFHHVTATASSNDPAVPFRRIATASFEGLSPADRFTGAISHRGVDFNGDGLYDQLDVEAGVTIGTPGTYKLTGELTDAAGNTIALAGDALTLPAGNFPLSLSFDGKALGDSGFSGDLILTRLLLSREDGSIADFRAPAATLSGYDASQFTLHPIRVLPGTTDQGVDDNRNGQYDRLLIKIPVQVSVSGYYDINARLMDASGFEFGWSGMTPYLYPGVTTLTLAYNGRTIGTHGVDGPYLLRDFSFYNRGSGEGINIMDFYTTKFYRFDEFEGAAADRLPPTWPAGSGLTVSNLTGYGLTLNWTAAQDNKAVAAYLVYQDGTQIAKVSAPVTTLDVTGLKNNTTYTFKVEAVDPSNNISTGGPVASATTLGPDIFWVPPLSSVTPYDMLATDTLQIRFKWLVDGLPTLDKSVAVRIRDGAGTLITGWVYDNQIGFDPGTGEYSQAFAPSRYNLGPGKSLKIMVYIGSKLRSTTWVNLH